jgi:hypothetical protein
MSMKATSSHPPRPAVEAEARHEADLDGFVGRNRDALNASIRRSREELGQGVHSGRTVGAIIADGRKRHGVG